MLNSCRGALSTTGTPCFILHKKTKIKQLTLHYDRCVLLELRVARSARTAKITNETEHNQVSPVEHQRRANLTKSDALVYVVRAQIAVPSERPKTVKQQEGQTLLFEEVRAEGAHRITNLPAGEGAAEGHKQTTTEWGRHRSPAITTAQRRKRAKGCHSSERDERRTTAVPRGARARIVGGTTPSPIDEGVVRRCRSYAGEVRLLRVDHGRYSTGVLYFSGPVYCKDKRDTKSKAMGVNHRYSLRLVQDTAIVDRSGARGTQSHGFRGDTLKVKIGSPATNTVCCVLAWVTWRWRLTALKKPTTLNQVRMVFYWRVLVPPVLGAGLHLSAHV